MSRHYLSIAQPEEIRMAIFNHHSFIVASALLLVIGGAVAWRLPRGNPVIRFAGWLVLLALLVGGWLLFRPAPSTTVSTLAEAEALIGNDSPTVLEFYSAY
jgi:hypothetical protein